MILMALTQAMHLYGSAGSHGFVEWIELPHMAAGIGWVHGLVSWFEIG
jgi:hypothetical protein